MKEKKPDKANREERTQLESNENREERIDKVMYVMAEIYGFKLSDDILNIYHEIFDLKYRDADEIEHAVKIWLSSYGDNKYSFFPKPGQLLEIMLGPKGLEQIEQQNDRRYIFRLPAPKPTEEQIEANLSAIKSWKEKKLPNLLNKIEPIGKLTDKEREKNIARFRAQAEDLKDLDNPNEE